MRHDGTATLLGIATGAVCGLGGVAAVIAIPVMLAVSIGASPVIRFCDRG